MYTVQDVSQSSAKPVSLDLIFKTVAPNIGNTTKTFDVDHQPFIKQYSSVNLVSISQVNGHLDLYIQAPATIRFEWSIYDATSSYSSGGGDIFFSGYLIN